MHGIDIGMRSHSLVDRLFQQGMYRGWFKYKGIAVIDNAANSNDNMNNKCNHAMEGDEEASCGRRGGGVIAFHNRNMLLVDDPYFAYTLRSLSSSASCSNSLSSSSTLFDSIGLLLLCTDFIFAYLIAWEMANVQLYDPELGAMLLSSKWLSMLALTCMGGGHVAITTNRALDPGNGWKLLDMMEVKNPCVWGSVGYIFILEEKIS